MCDGRQVGLGTSRVWLLTPLQLFLGWGTVDLEAPISVAPAVGIMGRYGDGARPG